MFYFDNKKIKTQGFKTTIIRCLKEALVIKRYVNYFTFLVVINPFMIISFQNCSRVPDRTLASLDKVQKDPSESPESRLSTSGKKETLKN